MILSLFKIHQVLCLALGKRLPEHDFLILCLFDLLKDFMSHQTLQHRVLCVLSVSLIISVNFSKYFHLLSIIFAGIQRLGDAFGHFIMVLLQDMVCNKELSSVMLVELDVAGESSEH